MTFSSENKPGNQDKGQSLLLIFQTCEFEPVICWPVYKSCQFAVDPSKLMFINDEVGLLLRCQANVIHYCPSKDLLKHCSGQYGQLSNAIMADGIGYFGFINAQLILLRSIFTLNWKVLRGTLPQFT